MGIEHDGIRRPSKGFESHLQRAQYPPWGPHYFHYDKFKQKLASLAKRRVLFYKSTFRQGNKVCRDDEVILASDRLRGTNKEIGCHNAATAPGAVRVSADHAGGYQPPLTFTLPQCRSEDEDDGCTVATQMSDYESNENAASCDSTSHSDDASSMAAQSLHPSSIDELYTAESEEFADMLDYDVEVVFQFYETQVSELQAKLDEVILRAKSGEIATEREYSELSDSLLELYAFVCINIITLRQILIRYDMFVKTFEKSPVFSEPDKQRHQDKYRGDHGSNDSKMSLLCRCLPFKTCSVWFAPGARESFSQWYLVTRDEHTLADEGAWIMDGCCSADSMAAALSDGEKSATHLHALLKHEKLMKLIGLYRMHLREQHLISSMARQTEENYATDGGIACILNKQLLHFVFYVESFEVALEHTHISLEGSGPKTQFRDRFLSKLKRYYVVGSIIDNAALWDSQFLVVMKGKTLKKELSLFAAWRLRKDFPEFQRGDAVLDLMPEPSWKKSTMPFMLNLMSTLFYLMNYYIVEPSSTAYVNYLGSNVAFVGLLIGAMPIASFASAIFYSMWTNYSFRHPLLFSACLLCIGNFVYAISYNFKSLPMAIVGRAICGLGEPRVINRRFVADVIPESIRTAISAAFAMACAIGSAAGPSSAIGLNQFDKEITTSIGTIYLNGLTGPGYLMFALWTAFALVTYFLFDEPDRIGLAELRQKEAQKEKDASLLEHLQEREGALLASVDNENSCDGGALDSDIERNEVDMTSSRHDKVAHSIFDCFRAMTLAVGICMFLEFISKFTLETLSAAISITTFHRYGWSIEEVGKLGCINGLLAIPLSIFVGWISQFRSDRVLVMYLLIASIFGSLLLVDITDFFPMASDQGYNEGHWLAVGPKRYVLGNMLFFAAAHAVECVNMSMFTKVVPLSLSAGTWNCGLLATVTGTLGRSFGDLFITAMGFVSLRNLLNLLYLPSGCALLFSVILVRRYYYLFSM